MNCEFDFGCPMVVNPFSPRNSYCLLVLCSKILAWQMAGWGCPKFSQREMWVALHLQLRSHWRPISQENCPSHSLFWLPSGIVSGSWEGNIFTLSLGMLLASKILFIPSGIFILSSSWNLRRHLYGFFLKSNSMVKSWLPGSWWS